MAATYLQRRREIETYFDRTAADAWRRLTSEAPLGRIRASVRAGRDRMRATLLDWLPADLTGARLLDAGCGTGALAVEAARRGADVTAIDLAASLVDLARSRAAETGPGRIRFSVGDMLDPGLGRFDHVVGMDSLIHYSQADFVRIVGALARRTERSLLVTFAPRTPPLAVMHAVGRLFPRGERAPAIQPVATAHLLDAIAEERALDAWQVGRTLRIKSGFYTSQALELVRR